MISDDDTKKMVLQYRKASRRWYFSTGRHLEHGISVQEGTKKMVFQYSSVSLFWASLIVKN